MRLPDFLAIGALKAGTTYLDGLLRSHPDLCLPTTIKEVEYFNRHYERGSAWYGKLFAKCGSRVTGEVSPQYLGDPRSPYRIQELVPDVRLLLSLRDPVQRAYSQYKHWVQVAGYAGDFNEFLDEHPGAVAEGRYFLLLSRYMEVFSVGQLHIILFEDLIRMPLEVMRGVFSFLGIDTAHTPPALDPANVSMRPRFPRAYTRGKRASQWLYDHRGGRIVLLAKSVGAPRLFGQTKEPRFGALTPTGAARLSAAYRDDIGQLSRLLDRDLYATWRSVKPN